MLPRVVFFLLRKSAAVVFLTGEGRKERFSAAAVFLEGEAIISFVTTVEDEVDVAATFPLACIDVSGEREEEEDKIFTTGFFEDLKPKEPPPRKPALDDAIVELEEVVVEAADNDDSKAVRGGTGKEDEASCFKAEASNI